ncbi:FAD-binding oxidoreductase [Tropicimonas sp. S265A]|uniref:FAD-binding oxidoreductase n=1 Tax=Tropicimonas sp. S265A TaxID=3415134 RepID=UPI003C7C5F04
MTHRIALQQVLQLTPDTRQYVFSRPSNYNFKPGQATDLALDREGWRDEKRPFTFTNDPDANILSFTIKSYPSHDGVTARLASLEPGDDVLIDEPWGAIEDKGPGVFLAAGAGITPFIGILKQRARKREISECSLHFANRTEDDIICRHLWENLPGFEVEFLLSDPQRGNVPARRLDAAYLDQAITDWDQRFYLCGPPEMEDEVADILRSNGVPDEKIVREE